MRHKEEACIKVARRIDFVYPIPRSSASPQSVLAQEIIAKACITQPIPYLYTREP
jgi:hypothetical protein